MDQKEWKITQNKILTAQSMFKKIDAYVQESA